MEMNDVETSCRSLEPLFPQWEKTKDLIEQLLDIMLNYRQSGHPGGSRSKLHILIATLLGGVMRWDIRTRKSDSATGSCWAPGTRCR